MVSIPTDHFQQSGKKSSKQLAEIRTDDYWKLPHKCEHAQKKGSNNDEKNNKNICTYVTVGSSFCATHRQTRGPSVYARPEPVEPTTSSSCNSLGKRWSDPLGVMAQKKSRKFGIVFRNWELAHLCW